MPADQTYKPDPAFTSLGDGFADPVETAGFPKAIVRYRNDHAARTVGLDTLSDEEWTKHFCRFSPLPYNLPQPLAQRYHGHQFRSYNPQIGDGRGFLFAQLRDDQGRLMDLGTKGSGTTPYSRDGDGRLTMKGGFREILASELLEALGTYTSKTLSIIETGESLMRGDEPSPTRSCVMVRLTHGNIRIGTFQRHAYFSDKERLIKLTEYCLKNYYGTEPTSNAEEDALTFLRLVLEKVAVQAAELMASGFVHGVLNTDNINITGEIFDFGPWRFLPEMDLAFTAAYFDETGLYSFGRQPDALHWNIYQLGGALTEIASEDKLKDILSTFPQQYLNALRAKLLSRLGIKPKGDQEDDALLSLVNRFMIDNSVAYEQFFFDWYGGAGSDRAQKSPLKDLYTADEQSELISGLKSYKPVNPDASKHDYFTSGKPCTLLIETVESLWSHIAEHDDWAPFKAKMEEIRRMGNALSN